MRILLPIIPLKFANVHFTKTASLVADKYVRHYGQLNHINQAAETSRSFFARLFVAAPSNCVRSDGWREDMRSVGLQHGEHRPTGGNGPLVFIGR